MSASESAVFLSNLLSFLLTLITSLLFHATGSQTAPISMVFMLASL